MAGGGASRVANNGVVVHQKSLNIAVGNSWSVSPSHFGWTKFDLMSQVQTTKSHLLLVDGHFLIVEPQAHVHVPINRRNHLVRYS